MATADIVLAKCYGLPKVHKTNFPMRSIISLFNSSTYLLAKYLYNDLNKNIQLPKSHLNNSFEHIEKINNFIIPDDYVLISLDVTSLFTNVSL